jgi:hypothetical protein
MQLSVNGKDVDLSKALPAKVGLFKAAARAGVNLIKLENGDFLSVMGFALAVMQKANPEITEADFDELPQTEIVKVVDYIKKAQQVVDRPTSGPSTSSTTTTAGGPETSGATPLPN